MGKTILVLGDSIIDRDIYCESIGLSLETPTLKTKMINETYSFGGAANVVNNLLSLGCKVYFSTAFADDYSSQIACDWNDPNLSLNIFRYNGQSVVKNRYWIERNDIIYKYLQVNQGTPITTSAEEIYTSVVTNIDVWEPDIVLLIDYRNGLFKNREHVKKIINYSQERGALVVSSSQTSSNGDNYSLFHGSDLICMNHHEATSHMPSFKPDSEGMKALSAFMGSSVCVTLGSDGSVLYDNGRFYKCRSAQVEVVDTCGAGDAFLAALITQYERKNLEFCNRWAALATTKKGVHVPDIKELNAFN